MDVTGDMTLLQLQIFFAVCHARSFTKAGETLHMTQSAVSQAVSNLEKELGVTLLIRNRQGVSVTYIGERVLEHVRDMLRRVDRMRQETSAAAGLAGGRLRIAATVSACARLLPGLLSSFRSRYPNIHTVLLDGTADEVAGWVANHVVDVGVTTTPVGGLDAIDWVEDVLCVCVPTGHRLETATVVRVEDVVDEGFIMPVGDAEQLVRQAFNAVGAVPNPQYHVRDISAVLAMVSSGAGVTLLPKLALPEMTTGVVCLPLAPPILRRLALIVRHINEVSPTCADFLLHARDHSRSCC